jgi:hypothetical protein
MQYKFYLSYISTFPLTDSGTRQRDGISNFDRQVWSKILGDDCDDCDAYLRTGAFSLFEGYFGGFREMLLAET